jgi:hypothetical protein
MRARNHGDAFSVRLTKREVDLLKSAADELRRAAEKSEADRVAWRAVAADLEALWREVGGPSA